MKKTRTFKTITIMLVMVLLTGIFTFPIFQNAFVSKNGNIFGTRGDGFTPQNGEYYIQPHWGQFDFLEEYLTCEQIVNTETNKEDRSIDWDKYYDDIVEDLINGLGLRAKGLTEYEKIAKLVYFVASFRPDESGSDFWDDAHIFRTNRCEMGALLIENVLRKVGVEAYCVNNSYHAWNVVKCDGNYYFVDWQVLSYKFFTPVTVSGGKEEIDIYYKKYAPDGMSSQNAKRTLEWFLNNTGKGKCPSTPYPKRVEIETYKINGKTYNVSLQKPKYTVKATKAGYVVTWDAVKDADFYDVYSFTFDGITNNFNINNKYWGGKRNITGVNDCIYKIIKKTWLASRFEFEKRIFAMDKNENGQHQCFVANTEDEGGRVFYIVARNVDGRVSDEPDTASFVRGVAKTDYPNADKLINKNTYATIDEGAIVKEYDKDIYAENSYSGSSHTHNFKQVRVVRKATTKNQGAVVYECTECLQRKMVYTPKYVCSHQWTTTTNKATLDKNGSTVQKCSKCGESKTTATYYAVNSITLDKSRFAYDGTQKTPSITVKDSKGNILKNGTDYTVSMDGGRTEKGTYNVKVTLTGKYSGTKTLSFTIDDVKEGFVQEDSTIKYYQNNSVVTGIQKVDGNIYYFSNNGTAQTGWQKVNNRWYFFGNDAKAYKWRKWINGKLYYFNGSGQMCTGWIRGNITLYANADGEIARGCRKIGNNYYLFSYANGEMVTGWYHAGNGKWYYYGGNGVQRRGWQTIGGRKYLFKYANGEMITGWYRSGNGSKYYFNRNGQMLTGWQKIGGKWYHFAGGGYMQTGWLWDNGKWYYLNSDGSMRTTRLYYKGKNYYFYSSGVCSNP